MKSKTKRSKSFDAAKYIDSDDTVAAYITEALSADDPDATALAVGVAARARRMKPKISR